MIARPHAAAVAVALATLLLAGPARAGPAGAPEPSRVIEQGAEGTEEPDSVAEVRPETEQAGLPRQRRALSLSPHRYGQCTCFLAIETSGSLVTAITLDRMDEVLVTNGSALMVNLDPRWSAGGGVDLHWVGGEFEAAPTLRCRRWLGRREQSVEATLGFLPGIRSDGRSTQVFPVGPLATLRYSPVPGIYVQGGLCRVRKRGSTYDPTTQSVSSWSHDHTRGFGGVGLAGGGAAVVLGLEAAALVTVIGVLEGMD